MIRDTPIEHYKLNRQEILVKREDLACLPPGPHFAKVRGLLPVLRSYKANGIYTFGYMETSVSMAGWGLSYFCQKLGLKAIIFYPHYKDGIPRDNQVFQKEKWLSFGAKIIPIENPNRLKINWYRARKQLFQLYPDAIMLPQGLPFPETVQEVAKQVKKDKEIFKSVKSIIISTGSGTMTAGVIKGLSEISANPKVYGVLVSQKSNTEMKKKILAMAGIQDSGLFASNINLEIIDAGYEYTQKEECECPFPANEYYDRKAWRWLLDHINKVKSPILFWNIGK